MYISHKVGPRTDPWTQLLLTILSFDFSAPHWTYCLLDISQFSRHFPTNPLIPALWQRVRAFPWSSRSNAFCRSNDHASMVGPWLSAWSTPFSHASIKLVWLSLAWTRVGVLTACCFFPGGPLCVRWGLVPRSWRCDLTCWLVCNWPCLASISSCTGV